MKKVKQTNSKTKSTSKSKVAKAKSAKKPKRGKKASDQKMLFVYGYGADAMPRAAAFTEPDLKLAIKAARLLGLSTFLVPSAEVKAISKTVRSGNVYASGDGFAPKVNPKKFADLMTSLKLTPPEPPVAEPEPQRPASWKKIVVGDLVLAESDDANVGGYWEVLVAAIEDTTLILRARDFPEVQVKRDRLAVALLYNAQYVGPEGLDEAAPGLPTDWATIKTGHLVLACLGKREGWYPAIVMKMDGQTVTAHWRDEPNSPFARPVTEVALLYPKAP